MPTYKEQYEKIIQAYFKDEIEPGNPRFCFCGTLCGNETFRHITSSNNTYTREEYTRMEQALFVPFGVDRPWAPPHQWERYENIQRNKKEMFEELLFEGMSAALDVLKDIHRKRGENVDVIETQFVKRKLETV